MRTLSNKLPLRDTSLTPSRLEAIGKRLAAGTESLEDLDLLERFQQYVAGANADIFGKIGEVVSLNWCERVILTERPRKRLDSIRRKIQREKTRLSTMQDLSGAALSLRRNLLPTKSCRSSQRNFPARVVTEMVVDRVTARCTI